MSWRSAYTDRFRYQGTSTSGKSSGGYSAPKTGNEKALERAKSYLRSSAFSYDGLVDQLEYEGFSESEAKYAVDHCGADWDEQALKKAKSYIKHSAFSAKGLQEQLEYGGFNPFIYFQF